MVCSIGCLPSGGVDPQSTSARAISGAASCDVRGFGSARTFFAPFFCVSRTATGIYVADSSPPPLSARGTIPNKMTARARRPSPRGNATFDRCATWQLTSVLVSERGRPFQRNRETNGSFLSPCPSNVVGLPEGSRKGETAGNEEGVLSRLRLSPALARFAASPSRASVTSRSGRSGEGEHSRSLR